MRAPSVVDTSVLLAALDREEPEHTRCSEVLRRRDLELVVPALVVTEVAFFADRRLGPAGEAAFVRGLQRLHVETPEPDDWLLIADMVERYADVRLGTADASIAVLADRLETDIVLTLDRRHFEAIRSPQGRAFRILPELRRVHDQPAGYAATADDPGGGEVGLERADSAPPATVPPPGTA